MTNLNYENILSPPEQDTKLLKGEIMTGLNEWIGTKYCKKCDLIGRQFCRCNSIPTFDPILLAPAGLTVDDRTYWHRRAQVLLGQPVTIVTQ